ncbi:MAG: alanine racemase [Sulfurimonas sp.]|uniref:alanine racemase n=1 Tax=Sulfurimonas sp. TaxID=2022749 RepID=UPI0026206C9C|nr:alanine racemase [Sulfurimonas sp.]MDD2652504.1 alanine racemase [Sulfurimonas sp.]MDD3452241.1 alanine racemase [Sulfurimonas sp.]
MAYIILNKNNFFNNLDIIANRTKSVDKIALVLKDNAYGHGLLEMATMASEYGITKAVVQTSAEADAIESFFDSILVLADTPKSANQKASYTINGLKSIEKFAKGTKVELKVDTGMHRNGVNISELEEAFANIKRAGLLLAGVFTHHRSADELTSEWFWQKETFKTVKQKARELACEFGFENLRFHSCNSAALFRDNDFDEDMARVGIAAYGCLELPRAFGAEDFKPVLSLFASKNSSRLLKAGARVGYGGDGTLVQDSIVSNYDFGYGDGFLRICTKNGYKTPKGVDLVGRISMDNSSFLGTQEELLIFDDARVAAKYAQTISYEVLTSLKSHLERTIV